MELHFISSLPLFITPYFFPSPPPPSLSSQSTGLGKRLSLLLIKYLGRSLVGLGYSVCLSEMLLGPLIPSNTARGSVVMAIVASICRSLGSTTETNPVTGGGQYLMLVGSHANLIAASMFQTGMAANPILSIKAKEVFGVDWQFSHWIMGSWVPALTAFILLPLYMKVLSKATVDISGIRAHIGKELALLGPLKLKEKVLMLILLCCLALWITTTFTGLDSTLVGEDHLALLSGRLLSTFFFFFFFSFFFFLPSSSTWCGLLAPHRDC